MVHSDNGNRGSINSAQLLRRKRSTVHRKESRCMPTTTTLTTRVRPERVARVEQRGASPGTTKRQRDDEERWRGCNLLLCVERWRLVGLRVLGPAGANFALYKNADRAARRALLEKLARLEREKFPVLSWHQNGARFRRWTVRAALVRR